MIPVDEQKEEEAMDVDSEWHDIPFNDTGPINEAGPSGSGSNPLVTADPEVHPSFIQVAWLIGL